jgi:hypothetical protein
MKSRFSKKAIIIVLVLLVAGLFIFFFLMKEAEKGKEEIAEEIKEDQTSPSTKVVSPEDKSWHRHTFTVEIRDSDLGSGLAECQYLIEDLGTGRVAGGERECGFVERIIPVGEEKICSSSYQKDDVSRGKCKVSSLAVDKAGNESGWESKVFNIDLIKPSVSPVNLSENSFELNEEYLLEATVSDNSKITGCWFYLDGERVDKKVEISLPKISVSQVFSEEKEYYLNFACADIAGNLGVGDYQIVKATTNHPPVISSCRVSPSQGNTQTEFQFEVLATDPEGDEISFSWDFGDGKNSTEKSPNHQYFSAGTYEPKVIAADSKGEKSECSTAWVVVSQDLK